MEYLHYSVSAIFYTAAHTWRGKISMLSRINTEMHLYEDRNSFTKNRTLENIVLENKKVVTDIGLLFFCVNLIFIISNVIIISTLLSE